MKLTYAMGIVVLCMALSGDYVFAGKIEQLADAALRRFKKIAPIPQESLALTTLKSLSPFHHDQIDTMFELVSESDSDCVSSKIVRSNATIFSLRESEEIDKKEHSEKNI